MESNIILSIIIPVYNSGKQLDETLESIKQVNFHQPYEIILVNDGSTDQATLDLLDSYDNKYRVVHKDNGGPSSARNLGISLAQGKYILPFDSDDLMHKNHFDLALKKMIENDSIDIIYGDMILFGAENRYLKSGNYNRMRLIYSGNFVPNSSIYKKEIWNMNGGYDESLIFAEDWDFWSRAAVKNVNFLYFPVPFYRYRKSEKSLSQQQVHSYYESWNKIRNKIPGSIITQELLSEYVITSIKENKKLGIKLLIIILFPKLFNFLLKKKIFTNKIIVE